MKCLLLIMAFLIVGVAHATFPADRNQVVVKTLKIGASSGYDIMPSLAGTHEIMTLPAGSVVKNVMAKVITAIAGSSAEIVGDASDTDGFLLDGFAATAGLYPAYKNGATPSFAGLYLNPLAMYNTSAEANGLKYYSTATAIDLVITGTPTAGEIKFVIEFMRL